LNLEVPLRCGPTLVPWKLKMTWCMNNTNALDTLNISVRPAYVRTMANATHAMLNSFKSGITRYESPPGT
jgi:hypothetical protein